MKRKATYRIQSKNHTKRGRGGAPHKIEILFKNKSRLKKATNQTKMDSHVIAVEKILAIYINKANAFKEKEQKIVCIAGLFDYLSTADVKPLLQTAHFAGFRNILLRKIHEFTNDSYIRARPSMYHQLHAVMRELFTYLVQDDSVPRRRSERQKKKAVKRFNARFTECQCTANIIIAASLKYWNDVQEVGTKLPKVSIKVLPRRSARLGGTAP